MIHFCFSNIYTVYTNFITIGNKKYNIVYPKERKRWVLLEDIDYTYLHALLDDMIEVRQNPDRLDTHI